MAEKLRFKPVITRIKLNPEQAVLGCTCYYSGRRYLASGARAAASTCAISAKTMSSVKNAISGGRS